MSRRNLGSSPGLGLWELKPGLEQSNLVLMYPFAFRYNKWGLGDLAEQAGALASRDRRVW